MDLGKVQVYVTAGKGKVKISTQHLEADTARVRAAMAEVGRVEITKESEAWPSKLRERYLTALKKQGLVVSVVDNRTRKSADVEEK